MTGFSSAPIPLISMRTTSPGVRKRRGSRRYPTPAGVPVVMGNAVDDLKRLGWPVTLDNNAGGVAAAIEQFALAGGCHQSRRP